MVNSPQHLAALRLLDESGISKSNYAPPLFRLLWRAGVDVPPPHFMSFFRSAVTMGTTFGIVWGLLFSVFELLVDGAVNIPVLLLTAICCGFVFGLAVATYYSYGRRRYKLPEWSALP